MQRFIYKIISILLCVIFLAGIIGCGKTLIEQINYDLYLNKIWIAENWLNGDDDNLFYWTKSEYGGYFSHEDF